MGRRRLPRIIVAALAMGGLLWLSAHFAPASDAEAYGLAQIFVLVLLISGAIAIYGALLALCGVVSWNEGINAFRPTTASDLRD
jgi:putative peptidoglycan lipid II flippase